MKRYLITGASGYIGSVLIEKLLEDEKNKKETGEQELLEITALVRNPKSLRPEFRNRVTVCCMDITDGESIRKINENYDYLIHCAAPTQSAYMMSHPVEVANTIVTGTKNILELAKRCRIKRMVYLSSMEVYGQIDSPPGGRIKEDQLGNLDIFNVRSCYPMAKRMAENLCYLYSKEYHVPVCIARLAQTFGRGMRAGDQRVYAQFADAVRNQRDIVLHTKGTSMGNYCDADDAVDAILFLLKNGKEGEAYNVVNENNTMMIREMAELTAEKIAGGKIRVIYDIPDDNRYGYATETGLRLSGAKLKELGWEAKVGLEEMYHNILDSSENNVV